MSISPRVKGVLLTVLLGIASSAVWDGIKKFWPAVPATLEFPHFLRLSDVVYSIVVAGIGVYVGARFIRSSAVPTLRPKIVPVRWGESQAHRFGLVIRNDGEPAFDISMDEPVVIGGSELTFWKRVYPGLTKADGELAIEAYIKLPQGSGTGGGALREQMVQANVSEVTLTIRYRDIDSHGWITRCELVRELWETGLRVSGVRQQPTPISAG